MDSKEGISIAGIARKYRVSRTTVYRWIRRFKLKGKSVASEMVSLLLDMNSRIK